MPLSINDIAPDFTAASTEGKPHFYDWAGDNCCAALQISAASSWFTWAMMPPPERLSLIARSPLAASLILTAPTG